ncbi:MAG: S8 family serine peptidase [Lachnospiraceae bacterium]
MQSIVKYHGDIQTLSDSMGLVVEILSENYAIMDLSEEEQFILSMKPQIEYIEEQKLLSLLGTPAMTTPCITAVRENYDLTGKGVLIAALDSGIDYLHSAFRKEDGTTRIISIWDQNVKGIPPAGFDIGNVYSQEQINAAIDGTATDLIPVEDYLGHGTAVAGIAAGNDRGLAPEASLLIVRPAQSTSPYMTTDINLMRGIKYAIDMATARNMPLVINMSYGTNQGSHDGSSLFEQYINDMAARWRTVFVVPTGNEGISGKHFQGKVSTGDSIDATFTIQKRLDSLSITLIKSFVDKFELQIIDSLGRESNTFYLKSEQELIFAEAQLRVSVIPPQPFNADQYIKLIFQDLSGNTLMATKWTIRIKGASVLNGDFNMWLPVTELSGENTAFLRPEVNTTLTIPSTVPNALSVGCCITANTYAEFSGRGFTISNVVKPEICAPAANVISTAVGGGYGYFCGTSFAAPITAGACALMMQWGIVNRNDITMYGQRLKAFLEYGALRKTSQEYPNPAWGYGALCLENSLDYARTLSAADNKEAAFTPREITALQVSETPEITSLPNYITRYNLPEGENPATSETYSNWLVPYDFTSIQFLIEHPDIWISSILQNKYAVIHIPYGRESEYMNSITVYTSFERSRMMGLLANPALDAAGITVVKRQPFLSLTGRGVLVGIVDTGIDYTLETFIYENGRSKILRIWDQTIESSDINNIPADFIYGTEFTREQIDQAIASDSPRTIVPTNDEVGHGTFLASLAAGRQTAENEEGAAPDAELVIVKLKQVKQITRDYSALTDPGINAYDTIDVLNGVEYLIETAKNVNRPIVIFLGLGTSDSAHDGLSYLSQYLAFVAALSNVIVISAVGNEGDRRHHAAGHLSGNEDMKEIEFNVTASTSGFFMSMWAFTPDRLSISLVTPLGEVIERRRFLGNERDSYSFIIEKSRITLDYEYPNAKNGSQSIFIRFFTPQIGLWRLRVYGDLVIDGRFNIWMPISSLWNNSAYFLQPEVNITVTTPSTAPILISVGAYNSFDGSIYVSSGRGPNRLEDLCPDFVAPGVNVTSVVPGGANGVMTGTSVAAAITAGACALVMQWAVVDGNYPPINNYSMKTFLLIGLTQRPGIIYPDNLWGYGELNLIESFYNI